MKYKIQTGIIIVCVLSLFVVQSIHSTATPLNNSGMTEETAAQGSTEQDTGINDMEQGSETEQTDTPTENMLTTEKVTEAADIEDQASDEGKVVREAEKVPEPDEADSKTGKYYFFQKYLYDCNAAYLEDYIAYLELQVSAYEEMYRLGEITEGDLKSCQSQKALAQAELETAKNESAYYQLYLTKNGLAYSNEEIKSVKEIEGVDYYIEKYPKKDYMTIARYVTDYQNATVGITAKQAEIDALTVNLKMAGMLLQEGEISELEYAQKGVSLAKAQYELEQKYVELNVAYWRLTMLCE